ncbi:fibrinogen-related protein [Burkholderia ubonensis]|uniref:fibrinogen-related protein n=1 Tax=Burkholderia ubonensis TaxID=101571 RepID=UPI00076D4CEA|nr:fibrinogen-related protein [Burkholderia ubonensis]KVP40096.1 hypothetical protein WJ87_07895 [Burkholderia ubonensis]
MKKTGLPSALCLAAFIAASAPAFAGEYYVVVPVPAKTAAAQNINVSLAGYSLPAGMIGTPYAGFSFKSLLSVTGDAGYTGYGVRWSLVSGALPAGLTLNSDGTLSGTPTASGTASFQVMASYKTKAGQQAYQVVVADITVALANATLPAGVQGAAYSYDMKSRFTTNDPLFTGAGVSWSLVSGSLPAGLSLSADGVISGTPTAENSGTPFTLQAAYKTKSGQQSYSVLVGAITVSLANATAPGATYGQSYNGGVGWDVKPNLTISGDAAYAGNGTGVTWSVTSGALPAGLTLNSNGTITGTPTGSGSNPVQLTASYKGKSGAQSYALPYTGGISQYSGYRAWSDGTLAANCNEYRQGKSGFSYVGATGDGIYRIQVPGTTPFDVTCDMTNEGGGWTVIQQRSNGSVNFYQPWAVYAAGFGTATTEYWLGLDRIAAMTASGTHELRIDMQRYTGATGYAKYTNFKVNPASDLYRLAAATFVGAFPAEVGNKLSVIGAPWSTYDAQHDTLPSDQTACAVQFHGAWWFTNCFSSHLNGTYLVGPQSAYAQGLIWGAELTPQGWTYGYESLSRSAMKVR